MHLKESLRKRNLVALTHGATENRGSRDLKQTKVLSSHSASPPQLMRTSQRPHNDILLKDKAFLWCLSITSCFAATGNLSVRVCTLDDVDMVMESPPDISQKTRWSWVMIDIRGRVGNSYLLSAKHCFSLCD